jgi:nucleoside-diphosphate-sugar epimerase
MPSVLITGANGFIGSHLCDALIESGYTVYGLIRATSDLRFLRRPEIKLIYGDLTEINAIRFPESVDVIVHAAALVSDNATRQQCRRHIYDITVSLVELAGKLYPRLIKFVYLSTVLTLGYCADNISERNPGRSADYVPYNLTKKQTEAYLLGKHRTTGFPVVVLRPGDVYGPRDRTSSELMLQAAEKGVPLIVGRGRKRFGLCYPTNLCRAVLATLDKPQTNGRAYTVVNRIAPTWGEFFRALQKGVGARQRIYVPVSLSLAVALFIELLRLLLPGFRPSINYYRIRRITAQTTYDFSETERDLGYDSDDDYLRQFESIVQWYNQEKHGKDKP